MTAAAAGTNGYPVSASARDRWIIERRPTRHHLRSDRPNAWFLEEEPQADGQVMQVGTVLLVNRECPFHCVMCDLWRDTLPPNGPTGLIGSQLDAVMAHIAAAPVVKLYNNGSFFDPRAIPTAEHAGIASRLGGFGRVVVECHPAFVGLQIARFAATLPGKLEVAMGLETAHAPVLAQLNKRMTLDSFSVAADRLREMGVASRVFVLVQPPFEHPACAVDWAVRSAEFAFDTGAGAVSLIAVRAGNGALDSLVLSGDFVPPRFSALEEAFERTLALGRGRVFADTWNLERVPTCASCREARLSRLRAMNLSQRIVERPKCDACDGH